MNDFNYRRRHSSTVQIGNVPLGGDNPIRIQSMTSTSTLDTDASVVQCRRIFDAGADYVRLTAQGVREAHNIGEIRAALHAAGYTKPLVADIHFNPKAAFEAAATTDKVRINPGNFVDAARTFKKLEYTDKEYAAELEKIRRAVVPFLAICREHHTAVRLGVNHGSLSDRIMSRYGDTPAGMVESAMEYLRIFREENFNDVAISIKASNTVIMVETVRRLVAEMDREDMHYPLHLGVTEAGDGEDGRIKSAVGIGTLLAEGIGDTVRVEQTMPLKITIAGRTKHFINAFGEELMVHNADAAIERACRQTGAAVANYTVAPVYATATTKGRHEWLIEFDRRPADMEAFADLLDRCLQQENSDYEAKRFQGIFIDRLSIVEARRGLFDDWLLQRSGKLGGQRKIPRLYNSRDIIDSMLEINKQSKK